MEKLNIAKILKDCPSGMELDSTIVDELYFGEVTEHMIKCYTKQYYESTCTCNTIYFHHDGTYLTTPNAKCVIFPKGKTTWEGFHIPFNDGDVLATRNGMYIGIVKIENGIQKNAYVAINEVNNLSKNILYVFNRLATEEEKQKLFQAIKDNGYKWNAETKTLEKLIVPKFKVGDKIRHKDDKNKTLITITGRKDDYYFIQFYNIRKNDYQSEKVSFKDQDKYELVPNKFDINTLEPFDKVLVRDNCQNYWAANLYSHYMEANEDYHFATVFGHYRQCIPYESNEHLLGTTNDCEVYFKTWE